MIKNQYALNSARWILPLNNSERRKNDTRHPMFIPRICNLLLFFFCLYAKWNDALEVSGYTQFNFKLCLPRYRLGVYRNLLFGMKWKFPEIFHFGKNYSELKSKYFVIYVIYELMRNLMIRKCFSSQSFCFIQK